MNWRNDLTKKESGDNITQHSLLARVAESADATDLKSVGLILRAGSSPATSTKMVQGPWIYRGNATTEQYIAEWSSW